MAKTWIKLTKPGAPFGLAHFDGDVLELDAEKAKKVMKAGGCVQAEPQEIAAAKAVIAKEEEKEAAAKAEQGPTNADLLAKIAELQKQLAEKK